MEKPALEKKPYQPPVLHKLGKIAELTKGYGRSGTDSTTKRLSPQDSGNLFEADPSTNDLFQP